MQPHAPTDALDEADFERRLLAIDWSVHQRRFDGPIPSAILGLMRSRPEEWSDWQNELEAGLLPQASLSNAVPYAIPFLLELLRHRRGQTVVYWHFSIFLFCTEDPRGDERLLRCRELLRSGLSVYLRDLVDTTLPFAVRSEVVSVVWNLPEAKDEWQSTLLAVLEAERTTELGKAIREYFTND